MSEFVIDISNSLLDFKHKLESEPRVVLSAGFGDGKTYFLKRFRETYPDEYHFFTLYPSQYVISATESIFEYIKRDILYQLVDQGLVSEELDLPGLLKDVMENVDITELLSFFLSRPVAKALGKIVESIKGIRASVEINSLSASKYLDSFLSVKGGIYENDAYTCLIRKCFDRIREQDGKEIVLIIEDLDRISPTNIFSILNIFGAHFDRHYAVEGTEEENKFGFDRLITVMDYDNIQTLYNHMFGDEDENSNFDGYIAKYICSSPFYYSIRREGRRLLTEKLYSVFGFTNSDDIAMKHIIDEELSSKSIRDLERIYLFDPDKILRDPEGAVDINGYLLAPNSPTVRIQAYKLFFGLKLDGGRLSSKNPALLTQVETNGPLWILHNIPSDESINGVKFNGKFFALRIERDEQDRIVAFHFKKARGISAPCPDISSLSDIIGRAKERIWEAETKFYPYFFYSTSVKENYELPDDETVE